MRIIHGLLISFGFLASLSLGACATAGTSAAFDQLPASEQASFNRCWEHMRVPTCGASADMAATLNCSRASSGSYAAYASGSERQRWLVSHGCPPSVASSGGAQ